MAKKPTARSEFVLFDVIYEDGSQRSNRRACSPTVIQSSTASRQPTASHSQPLPVIGG